MVWSVIFHDAFDDEFKQFEPALKTELLAHAGALQQFGPGLGRPLVDTLNGSKHSNMKELRFNWEKQVWRVAFVFDPKRQAIFLTAGDKCGADQKRFYKSLIGKADLRFDQHLESVRSEMKSR